MSAGFAPCAVIPVYNHEHAVGRVVAAVLAAGLHCFAVDDGSGRECAAELDRLSRDTDRVTLLRLPRNLGKGGAVSAGLAAAHHAGFTHALQIDADGQHALDDIGRFVDEARRWPSDVICGRPRFDASIPKLRLFSRYLTHVFVWLDTLSFDIPDSMCGFRVYPLASVMPLVRTQKLGSRMDFDVEILVRLHWRGQPMRWLDTRVSYPLDGVSHYRLLRDNALMVRLQTLLLAGMVIRLPALLRRRLQ